MNIQVGCSGWHYRHWKDTFYPQAIPQHKWFKHYTEQFTTVELNAPFYRWPTDETVKRWYRQAPQGFIYTVKVNGIITHQLRFIGTKKLIQEFYQIADILKEKMGCFLFQLPPSMHYSKAMLTRIMRQLDPKYRNVIEFRHKSWWNETTYSECMKAGIIMCSVSAPRLPDDIISATGEIYVRMHGPLRWYKHDYSEYELESWLSRIEKTGAKNVWIYFNNDFSGYAPKNAKQFVTMCERCSEVDSPQADLTQFHTRDKTSAKAE